MRFLVVSKSVHPLPMEATGMLLEAMRGWVRQNTANKKMEQSFGFAGLPGGGGILNVNTLGTRCCDGGIPVGPVFRHTDLPADGP